MSTMFRNYLKTTFRNILKHKGYSFINILGLAIGMVVCIFIFLWVRDELSFDRFHQNSDEIYRVVEDQLGITGIFRVAVTPWPLGQALVKDYPEVINSARFLRIRRRLIRHGDKCFYENGIYVADPSFLEIFSFPMVKGDPATALSGGNNVVITEKIAEKYFGDEDPMGKTITSNNKVDYTVTGVIKNVPHNSHIKFDFLLPLEQTLKNSGVVGNWSVNVFYTFLLLQKNADPQTLEEKIYEYRRRVEPHYATRFRLQALTDMHLRSDYSIDLYGVSKDTSLYVYLFPLIAVLILLIAFINFVNLTVARTSTRAREVGIRKVMGARKMDLIKQFFGESILLAIIALIFAVVLVYLLLPLFNNLAGKNLTLDVFVNSGTALGLLLIVIITGAIAGIYPALILSAFQPTNIIRENLTNTSGKPAGLLFRRILVVFQFTLSVVFIIGTWVVNRQLSYVNNKQLGYEKDQVLYFTKRGNIDQKYNAFKEELQKNPKVLAVTTSSDLLTYTLHSTNNFFWEGKIPGAKFMLHHFSVDHDYLKTLNMEVVDGRDFSKDFTTDSEGTAFIVNEAAVKAMNLEKPVGKRFGLGDKVGSIIGVVKDFHYKSLHNEIEPLVLRIAPERDRYIFVNLRSENISETLNDIKKIHQKFNPQYPFEYHFLDDQLNRLYDNDRKTFTLLRYFTFIAILLSCLGLFGLAAFMAQMRTREIGIRKVVGASVFNITLMLSKEFLFLVVISSILAWPIAYFVMNRWLQSFAYRTAISSGIFIFSTILALFIAIFTVIYQSIKAATANPVDVIRYE